MGNENVINNTIENNYNIIENENVSDNINNEDDDINSLIENHKDIQMNDKNLAFLKKVVKFVGIFRANPHLFVEHYLNIKLKDFQKVLLWEFVNNNYYMYIASRG